MMQLYKIWFLKNLTLIIIIQQQSNKLIIKKVIVKTTFK